MNIEQEINELHDFFQAWFASEVPQSQTEFGRVTHVLNDGFVLISPDGTMTARADLLEKIYAAYGGRPNFRIWIENFRLHHAEGGIAVATYEEWQTIAEKTTARLSSAIFQTREDAPNGVAWLHVHETWMRP